MKILCLGDVVGRGAVLCLQENLRKICRETGAEITVINGENASMGSGNGISKEDAELLFEAGADVITGGNHFASAVFTGCWTKRPPFCAPAIIRDRIPEKAPASCPTTEKTFWF